MSTRLFASNKLKPLKREKLPFLEDSEGDLERAGLLDERNIKRRDSEEVPEGGVPLKEILILLLVPIAWGSYSPLVKNLYSNPNLTAPPFLIFNFLSYIVSFSSISSVKALRDLNSAQKEDDDEKDILVASESDDSEEGIEDAENRKYLLGLSKVEASKGLELGGYLFVGSSLQVLGIQSISAIKASVLVQCTTILVPLLDSFLNKKALTPRTLSGCLLALLGVLIITIENPVRLLQSGVDISALTESGSLFICIATVFYSLHVVRLGQVANKVNALNLARAKSGTELVLSGSILIVVIGLLGMTQMGGEYRQYISDFGNTVFTGSQTPLLAAVLWNGGISTALTTWAQTVAQRNISSTTANIVYSSQPIFASLFSAWFLQEQFTDNLLLGSSVLAAAILLIVTEKLPDRR